MTRFLLTLLALMSGLLVQSAPAQARVCGPRDAEVAVQTPQQGARAVVIGKRIVQPPPREAAALGKVECRRKPAGTTIFIPTVQLGPDRARE